LIDTITDNYNNAVETQRPLNESVLLHDSFCVEDQPD